MIKEKIEKERLPSIAYLAAPSPDKPDLQASTYYIHNKPKVSCSARSSTETVYSLEQNIGLHRKRTDSLFHLEIQPLC